MNQIMKDEDLLSIVQELPLYVQLTLYRQIRASSPTGSLISPNEDIFSQPSSRNLSPETTPINVSLYIIIIFLHHQSNNFHNLNHKKVPCKLSRFFLISVKKPDKNNKKFYCIFW